MEPEPPLPDEEPEAVPAPREFRLLACPRCGQENVADAARTLRLQYCTACGNRLAQRHKRRRWLNWLHHAAAPMRRIRERVWMPIAGVTLAAVIAAIFILWMVMRPEPKPEAAPPVPMSAQVSTLMQRLGAAHTAEEILPLIREPEKHAARVRGWCAAAPLKLPLQTQNPQVELTPQRASLGYQTATVTASFASGPSVLRILCVETADGWRIDWPAFAHTGDMTAAECIERKPAEPVLLYLIVQQSTYYNGPYADAARWLSLRATDAAGSTVFYAAVPRHEDSLLKALADLPPPAETVGVKEGVNLALHGRRKALRVKFSHPQLQPPHAEVTAVEGDGWFIP
jgi:hypothetical protein